MTDGARLGRRPEPAERTDPPDALEGAAQLGLEHDDEGEQADDRTGLQDPGQEPQVERDGQDVHDEQDAHADDQADGPCPPDQAEQPVDQERGEPDIEDRGQAHLFEDRSQELRHRVRV